VTVRPVFRSPAEKHLFSSPRASALARGERRNGGTGRAAGSPRRLILSVPCLKAETAKLLVGKMTEVGHKVLDEAKPLVKDDPVAAYFKLVRLPAVYTKDTTVGYQANELLTKLKQDPKVIPELKAQTALVTIQKLDMELGSKAGSFDPTQEKFRKANAVLLAQLQEAVQQMKRTYPKTRATEDAVRIGEKYGVTVR
jgi:hypothetical protein